MPNEAILIATGNGEERDLLCRVLARESFSCLTVTAPFEAIPLIRRTPVSLAIVDGSAAGGDGQRILEDLRTVEPPIAVIVVVGQHEADLAVEAGRRGASDFMTRPFDLEKIPIRVRVTLERRRIALQELSYRQALEKRINMRTKEVWDKKEKIRTQMLNTIQALVTALQAKHDYTGEHSRRVADVSIAVARGMKLPAPEVRNIELAALFHDIGKIGLRDDVLNKQGALTPAEYEHVKQHPLIAEQILAPIEDFAPILAIVKHEHERFDGLGYPSGLKGSDIPLGARIIAIADTYDALLTDRSYRKGCSREKALAEIRRCSGTQFDPALVELFVDCAERLEPPSPVGGNGNGRAGGAGADEHTRILEIRSAPAPSSPASLGH